MACIYENGKNDKQDCSSGCDSGWTLYLQHSSDSQTADDRRYFSALRTSRRGLSDEVKRSKQLEHEPMMSEEEEEDMSMVSDASSGPPHNNLMHEEEVNCHNNFGSGSEECSFDSSLNRKKSKGKRRRKVAVVEDHHQSSSLLDDTASSPCLDFFSERYRVSSGSCDMLQENALDYSQGYSTTHHYNMRPERGVQLHCDFLNSFPSGNQMGHDQWF